MWLVRPFHAFLGEHIRIGSSFGLGFLPTDSAFNKLQAKFA